LELEQDETLEFLVLRIWERNAVIRVAKGTSYLEQEKFYGMLTKMYQAVVWNAPQDPLEFGASIWHEAILADIEIYVDNPQEQGGTMCYSSWRRMTKHLGFAWAQEHTPTQYVSLLTLFLMEQAPVLQKDIFGSSAAMSGRVPFKAALLDNTYVEHMSSTSAMQSFGVMLLHISKVDQIDRSTIAFHLSVPPFQEDDAWGPATHIIIWVDPKEAPEPLGTVQLVRRSMKERDDMGRFVLKGLEPNGDYRLAVATVHGVDIAKDEVLVSDPTYPFYHEMSVTPLPEAPQDELELDNGAFEAMTKRDSRERPDSNQLKDGDKTNMAIYEAKKVNRYMAKKKQMALGPAGCLMVEKPREGNATPGEAATGPFSNKGRAGEARLLKHQSVNDFDKRIQNERRDGVPRRFTRPTTRPIGDMMTSGKPSVDREVNHAASNVHDTTKERRSRSGSEASHLSSRKSSMMDWTSLGKTFPSLSRLEPHTTTEVIPRTNHNAHLH